MSTKGIAVVGIRDLDSEGEWHELAECKDSTGQMTELYYSEIEEDIVKAKRACGGCAVRAECLDHALSVGEPAGVWGGELIRFGKIVKEIRREHGKYPKYVVED